MHHLFKHWRRISSRLHSASVIALFLDFDGTLTPLAPRPDQVSLDGSIQRVLSALARSPHFRVWIISGRRQADVRTRVGVSGIRYLGLHGWEGRGATLPDQTSRCLRTLWSHCSTCLESIPGVWIEDKEYAFAVHYRDAAAQDVLRARAIVDRIIGPCSRRFRIEEGKNVWEVLPLELEDKGVAVLRELADSPANTLAVYVGDDQTDESAFTALRSGITVRVGPGMSQAVYGLCDVAQVRKFLQNLRSAFA
jgi:trehalose-phosphatase